MTQASTKTSLSVQLGKHHGAFIQWCAQEGLEPASVVRCLIDGALSQSNDASHSTLHAQQRSSEPDQKLQIRLGESCEAFMSMCSQKKVSPTRLAKQLVLEQLSRKKAVRAPKSDGPEAQFEEQVGTLDTRRVRISLNLSQSELEALEALSALNDESVQKQLYRALRFCLTHDIGFSHHEAEALSMNNFLLMKACNRIERLTRSITAPLKNDSAMAVDIQAIKSELETLRSHAHSVSDLLIHNQARWHINPKK